MGAVIALTDPTLEQHVALRQRLELCQGLGLTQCRGQLHGCGAPDTGGHDGVYQPIQRGLAHGVQHVRLVLGTQADVAGGEFAWVFQVVQSGGGGMHQILR